MNTAQVIADSGKRIPERFSVPGSSLLSAFPSFDTARTADTAPPSAPTNLVLRQGDLSGQIVARYHPSRASSINEVQVNSADPNIESNWVDVGMFSGGKANLAGFAHGTTIWVRVRTVGLNAVMGSWSDPASLFVV